MTSNPEIRFVYFDAAETLLHLSGVHERLGALSGKDEFTVINAWKAVNLRAQVGKLDRFRASNALAAILGIDGPFDAEDHVYRLSRTAINSMHQNMIRLAQMKVPVGVASNAWDGMVEMSINDGHIPEIPKMVVWTSAKAGEAKPDKKAWQSMAKQAGYRLNHIMLVNDSQKNIESAEHHGFGDVFKVNPDDFEGSAMLLHAKLVQLGLLC